jgi:hypothetical protein
MASFSDLLGKTLTQIDGATEGSECIRFFADDGSRWRMEHYQDCCESVDVAEIVGDVADLIGSPILLAEEVTHDCVTPDGVEVGAGRYLDDSYTWTFYKLATAKGHVTLRWLGTSNGYYSESVDFAAEQVSS